MVWMDNAHLYLQVSAIAAQQHVSAANLLRRTICRLLQGRWLTSPARTSDRRHEQVARMTTRAPIININHDPRFIALASTQGKAVHHHVTAFLALGSYVALELRVRGCVVIHGSSFWSKLACHMKPALNGYQMLSWDAYGNGDERQMVHRGWAIYEKQLFTEKMVSVCFMGPAKVSEWDGNIKASILNQQEFAEIWEDRGRIDVSMGVSASTWSMLNEDKALNPERKATALLSMPPRSGRTSTLH